MDSLQGAKNLQSFKEQVSFIYRNESEIPSDLTASCKHQISSKDLFAIIEVFQKTYRDTPSEEQLTKEYPVKCSDDACSFSSMRIDIIILKLARSTIQQMGLERTFEKECLVSNAASDLESRLYEIARIAPVERRVANKRINPVVKIAFKYGNWKAVKCLKIEKLEHDDRYSLALGCLNACPSQTSSYISRFNLEKDSVLDIALRAAKDEIWTDDSFRRKYDLPEDMRLEVAERAAEAHGAEISNNIQYYDLKREKNRFVIAKLAASSHPKETSSSISNYSLSDSNRLKVALIVAERDIEAIKSSYVSFSLFEGSLITLFVDIFSRNITASKEILKYDLKDNQRFEVAKKIAELKGTDLSKNIQHFGLDDEQHRKDVALIAALDKNEGGVLETIGNYSLNEESRFEVAKTAAANSNWNISQYIENFALSKEEYRFEVAKLATSHDARKTSMFIRNFHLEDKEHLFEVAKIVAEKDPKIISKYIHNFELTENHRYELLKILIPKIGWKEITELYNFYISPMHMAQLQWEYARSFF